MEDFRIICHDFLNPKIKIRDDFLQKWLHISHFLKERKRQVLHVWLSGTHFLKDIHRKEMGELQVLKKIN